MHHTIASTSSVLPSTNRTPLPASESIPGLGPIAPWLMRLGTVSVMVGWSWNRPRSGAGSP